MHARVRRCAVQVAMVYAGIGNQEKALRWLEQGHQDKQAAIHFIGVEYRFRPLRQDPRFVAILSNLGLKPAEGAS
jgi:hypothetical protein